MSDTKRFPLCEAAGLYDSMFYFDGHPVIYADAVDASLAELEAQLAEATKAPPIATNTGWPHEKALHAKIERLGRALELALYYVEGDAAFEIVKEKTAKIVRGEE